ncbi:MAG: nucleoside hydrolase, partial [Thermoguttaceae bacterium]|nr:nucleoside hydrolase [Thermoguttaceae bacterium]
WDLVVPFCLIHPDYLRLSEPGRVSFREDGSCVFTPEENGRDRYIILPAEEEITRLAEAFAWLVSQPPKPNK